MTTTEPLKALRERVESAEGPDREIDALLVVIFDIRPDWLVGDEGAMYVDTAYIHPVVRWQSACMKRSPGNPPAWEFARIPTYTASLDAALALVERVKPGWHFMIEFRGHKGTFNVVDCEPEESIAIGFSHYSAPLALLSALLKSLESEVEQDNG